MRIHLIDGTYELFRHFYAVPPALDPAGLVDVGAVRGVVASVLGMLESGEATHIGVATDTVIESFRNDLYPGYKTGDGIDPALWRQFPILEEALALAGVVVWPMREFEADDALASAAARAAADPAVTKVLVCSPDKDLAQCVEGVRVVQLDRRRGIERDEAGVVEKWGVKPESIPDYLALVGDSADGYPGLPGWGAKATAAVLGEFGHLEAIPADAPGTWPRSIRGAARLAAVLRGQWDDAVLFRTLATLRRDAPVLGESVDELRWRGPDSARFASYCENVLGAPQLAARAEAIPPICSR